MRSLESGGESVKGASVKDGGAAAGGGIDAVAAVGGTPKMLTVIDCSGLDLDSYGQFLAAKPMPFYRVQGRKVSVMNHHANAHADGPTAQDESVLFDYQRFIVNLAQQRARFAVWADCGLGKTLIALAWLRRILPPEGKALIVAPLMVVPQWLTEEAKFYKDTLIHDIHKGDVEEWAADPDAPRVAITNHDKFHEPRALEAVSAVVLDESSILKNADGKTRTALTSTFKHAPWRLCLSATPAPNDREEYANHATFLDYTRSNNEFYARFFVNTDDGWVLKPHALEGFHRYLAVWSVFLRNPERFGFRDNLKGVPKPNLNIVRVPWTQEQRERLQSAQVNLAGEHRAINPMERKGELLKLSRGWDAAGRVPTGKTGAILDALQAHPGEPAIVWCQYNEEQTIVEETLLAAGYKVVGIRGATLEEDRAGIVADLERGRYDVLVTKPKLLGFGLNLPFVTVQVFNGLTDSWEQTYQSLRRSYRYGAKKALSATISVTPAEEEMLANVLRKRDTYEADSRKQEDHFIRNLRGEVDNFMGRPYTPIREEEKAARRVERGGAWTMHRGDNVPLLRSLEAESVDFAVFSPPFANLFTYSSEIADMGNSDDGEDEFNLHYAYFLKGLERVMRPGRIVCCHVAQLSTFKGKEGHVGLKDFRGTVIRLFQEAGFHYYGEWCIAKNPQMQAIKEKVRSLAFAQLESNRLGSRPGINDFILIFKKPGEAVAKVNDPSGPTRDEWISWACGTWSDIRESDTLQVRGTKSKEDVKHICPLQLEPVRRCIRMYSSPGEVVLDPFAGIGSTGVVALEQGRAFIGVELKTEYWEECCRNLAGAEKSRIVANATGSVSQAVRRGRALVGVKPIDQFPEKGSLE